MYRSIARPRRPCHRRRSKSCWALAPGSCPLENITQERGCLLKLRTETFTAGACSWRAYLSLASNQQASSNLLQSLSSGNFVHADLLFDLSFDALASGRAERREGMREVALPLVSVHLGWRFLRRRRCHSQVRNAGAETPLGRPTSRYLSRLPSHGREKEATQRRPR